MNINYTTINSYMQGGISFECFLGVENLIGAVRALCIFRLKRDDAFMAAKILHSFIFLTNSF